MQWSATDYAVAFGAFAALALLFVVVWWKLGRIGIAQYAIILLSTCVAIWLHHFMPPAQTTFSETESDIPGNWLGTFLLGGFLVGVALAYLLTIVLPRRIRSRQ